MIIIFIDSENNHISTSNRNMILFACIIAIVTIIDVTLSLHTKTKFLNKPKITTLISNIESFESLQALPALPKDVVIIGNTSTITSNHPVIKAMIQRWKSKSKPTNRNNSDTMKIALSIEGGGMRGCVAAGSSAAINFLGLNDAIDIVYGSSAGSMIGSYFISRQLSGCQIYHGIIYIIFLLHNIYII